MDEETGNSGEPIRISQQLLVLQPGVVGELCAISVAGSAALGTLSPHPRWSKVMV
jgi:hypothetical protein